MSDTLASWRRTLTLIMTLAAMAGLMVVRSEPAAAACSGDHVPEQGTWVNADPNANGISRIQLEGCQPLTVCDGGTCSSVSDAGWAVRVWGKCHPTDCDWDWSNAERIQTGQIHAHYDQGFAKRDVYAQMSPDRPGQLEVFWQTDFAESDREDYSVQEWFVPAS
jgi:hypothetical protein